MKLGKISLLFLIVTLVVLSCKKDDDGDILPVVVIRDRTEQQMADNDSIIKYLTNHYYNSSELGVSNLDAGIQDIVITELIEGEALPDGHTLLIDAVGTSKKTIYEDTNYEYYVLNINQGGGTESPTFADTVQILYEGFELDNAVFDFKFFPDKNPFDLTGVITGWSRIIPEFNVAESFVINDDGTTNYYNSGLGIMFLPSGLAYFNGTGPTGGLNSYSPLVFKFELIQAFENDHDGDGIPSYLEDLNGDGEFTVNFENLEDDTDDDTDGDSTPNYADPDDDGDGVLTINEDTNNDGDPTNDIGANGIPKYLDDTETESK